MMSGMLKNPNGTLSLSRLSFAISIVVVMVKVLLSGVWGSIDGGMIAAILGPSGLTYAARMHSMGTNAGDPAKKEVT